MIHFSERLKISDKYNDWAKENNINVCSPMTVIAFLQSSGLLNEKAFHKFLSKDDKEEG